MTVKPSFFVPNVPEESQEAALAELAELAHQPIPSPADRVYSIDYRHNGEDWTATVGKTLYGVRVSKPEKGSTREHIDGLSDGATVLAIFPSDPLIPGGTYVVMTNKYFDPTVRSHWENPFFAGRPKSVTLFATPKSADKPWHERHSKRR